MAARATPGLRDSVKIRRLLFVKPVDVSLGGFISYRLLVKLVLIFINPTYIRECNKDK